MQLPKNFKLLPREIPRDDLHASILSMMIKNPEVPVEALFNIPGIGFHETLYQLSMHYVSYFHGGQGIFVVPPALQDAFMRTPLHRIDPADFSPDHPSPYGYIALPNCPHQVWGGDRTGWHQVSGAFYFFNPTDGPRGKFRFYIWGAENEKSQSSGDDAALYFTIDLQKLRDQGLDFETYIVNLMEGGDHRPPTGLARTLELQTPLPAKGGPNRAKAQHETLAVSRILLNTLLYIDSENADIQADASTLQCAEQREQYIKQIARLKSPGKKKRVEKKLYALPLGKIIWVAPDVAPPKGSVQGQWLPHKRSLRRKLKSAQKVHEELEGHRATANAALANEADPEKIASHLQRILHLEDSLAAKREKVETLTEAVGQKLRWEPPT